MSKEIGRNQSFGILLREGVDKVNGYISSEYGDDLSKGAFLWKWTRFIAFSLTHFTGPDDYFVNRLWRKSRSEINTFITIGKMYKLRKIYNYKGNYKRFSDKAQFNTFFHDYVKRAWITVDDATDEEIAIFIKNNKKFICKPQSSHGGRGIMLYHVNDEINTQTIRQELKGYELEELIIQHDRLQEINPHSVNTLRITTIKEDDDVHIISAMFRCGTKDAPVDNWSQGGLTAAVDIDTGIIFTKAIQKLPRRRDYVIHPTSGVVLVGFQIPFWEETKQMVYDMASRIDDVRMVGWDMAITNDGPCVVEGNHSCGTTILSTADDIGKYKVIKDIRSAYGRKMRRES